MVDFLRKFVLQKALFAASEVRNCVFAFLLLACLIKAYKSDFEFQYKKAYFHSYHCLIFIIFKKRLTHSK